MGAQQMNAAGGEPSQDCLEQAAQWYALLRSGEADADETQRWQRWLAEHPHHQQAWQFVERIGQRFDPLRRSPNRHEAAQALRTSRAGSIKRRQVLLGLAAIGSVGALSAVATRHTALSTMVQARMAAHTTAVGELREVALPDGSRLWLNAGSALDHDFDDGARRLHLHAGEAFIEVAENGHGPLLVQTAQGTVQAVATRLNVRVDSDLTQAAVYAGQARLQAGLGGLPKVLQAGQQAAFDQHAVIDVAAADLAREAWTRGVILAQDIPLAELVAELRRYRRGYLALADEVAQLRVFGSFPLHDPDAALAMLSQALPIEVRQRWPWWVSIHPRSA